VDWQTVKMVLTGSTGISEDAFHILISVGLQVFFAAALRRPIASWAPWAVVLILTLGNEWADLAQEIWPDRFSQWLESVKDVLVTMTLPSLLLLLSRWQPGLFAPQADGTGPSS
jgi:hypothetical protein